MKKILVLITLCCSAIVMAQNPDSKIITPPIEVTKAFQKAFPKIKPQWEKAYRGDEKTELEYDADFAINNVNMKAVYTVFGVFKVLEYEISAAEIPNQATEYLSKNYPKHRVIKAIKVMDNSNNTHYEIGIDVEGQPSDFVFNGSGDFLKAVEK